MIGSGRRLASILIGAVALGGCRSAVSGKRSAPVVAAIARPKALAPQHEATPAPPSAAGYRFTLLPDPDQLYGYDRVAVTRGGAIVQTLSLSQDQWVQSAEELKASKFSLFDIDRNGNEDVILWSERKSIAYVTTWRFEVAEGRFWPHPTVYHVRERIAPRAAAERGAVLSAFLLTEEEREPDSEGKPEQPEAEAHLSFPILIHRDGHIVDIIENEEWVAFDGVAMGLAGGSDGTPFVDANFDGHDDLMLPRSPCTSHSGSLREIGRGHSTREVGDGKTRPLGIPALEDKILQQAVRWIIEPIYEALFIGFSYGLRPNRSAHDALDALATAIYQRVNWVLDADIRSFFALKGASLPERPMSHGVAVAPSVMAPPPLIGISPRVLPAFRVGMECAKGRASCRHSSTTPSSRCSARTQSSRPTSS